MMHSRDAVKVTDHCLVRYLERQMGLNVEMVREHILSLCGGAAAFGATSVRVEGMRFEIDNGAIVTVVKDQPLPSKISRQRAQQKIAERG